MDASLRRAKLLLELLGVLACGLERHGWPFIGLHERGTLLAQRLDLIPSVRGLSPQLAHAHHAAHHCKASARDERTCGERARGRHGRVRTKVPDAKSTVQDAGNGEKFPERSAYRPRSSRAPARCERLPPCSPQRVVLRQARQQRHSASESKQSRALVGMTCVGGQRVGGRGAGREQSHRPAVLWQSVRC